MVNKMEEIMQNIGRLSKKFNSLGRVVDYINEEVTPKVFKEKTEEVFDSSMKILKKLLDSL